MMATRKVHESYCFGGQAAACPGYFTNDVLPCICGASGSLLSALSLVAMPSVPIVETEAKESLLPLSA